VPSAYDIEGLRAHLNPPQQQAVFHEEGPLLVLAGAGSGKTRVLTFRIAYLIGSGLAEPYEVLAITFTNKAAQEMKERVAGLVGPVARTMWVSTFHSACARILRREAELLGYTPSFTIYDQQDQVRLVRHCLEELSLDCTRFPPQAIHARISDAKNRLISPDSAIGRGEEPGGMRGRATGRPFAREEAAGQVYSLYQKRLFAANAMDFDDLIMRAVDLFNRFPERLERYRQAFRYVLVDEYQDTNHAQYVLVRLLSEGHGRVTVVGDDDQSVYSWRGADIRNILEFEKDFPEARVVKLEQNYRSTTTILEAANAVVTRNRGRKSKHLWSDLGRGEPINLLQCRDEHEEARLVAGEIEGLIAAGRDPREIAIFYRVNAQSRVLEDILVRYGISYQVVGGTRFYERAEIKDALAYLRAVVNPTDDLSFLRIINTPKRGLGLVAQERLRVFAESEGYSLQTAFRTEEEVPGLTPAAQRTRRELAARFAVWAEWAATQGQDAVPVSTQVEGILEESGLLESLRRERTLESEGRLENLAELVGVAREFDRNNPGDALADFLQEISLYADIDAYSEGVPQVTLMTLHNAKGLEFPVVFIVGMEEGIFPHARSLDDQSLEEERRLFYVGMTRAMTKLHLSHARSRSLYGSNDSCLPSRFLEELPESLIEAKTTVPTGRAVFHRPGSRPGRRAGSASDSVRRPRFDATSSPRAGQGHLSAGTASGGSGAAGGFHTGDRVIHAKFGEGVILGVEPGGVVRVFFSDLGEQKNLLTEYAPLKRV
jgi:DNA helicase-2/ATP-dependent DNA helicase PcrA